MFEEADELFWVGLGKTRDERYLVIASASKDTTELHVLDADDAQARPRVVLPRGAASRCRSTIATAASTC